jgi:hypothetical protein
MTDAEKIDKALRDLRTAGQTEPARQLDPVGHERNPPKSPSVQESEWSGKEWGGRSR